ncbi:hypothetical protein CROQUDRAFT_651294 [Cronartium quercuum f. sp. fusiforme G11]|uniref:Uncharacterized protein n=1 Tax=Cronartium quercuum f. sp. fusiforme G11 TaxID=708437 RepID=A0A9P6TI50_9BASI|nr:hypothetical protein CROQUDRAFT_651294 [Cronartium quercuum f. sp. fusiforme G11]
MNICLCSSCVTKTCVGKDGNKIPGQFVSRQVQLKHHLADVDASTSSHKPPSLDSSPEPEIAEDQNLNSEGLDLGYEQLQLDACDTSLTVITLLGVFLGWLHLFCELSSVKCGIARDFLLQMFQLAWQHPLLDDTGHHRLPKDIRTTIKSLSVILELEKQICCATCFSLYKPSDAPWLCSYKKSQKA